MKTTTIRIPRSAHAFLHDLAVRDGVSMREMPGRVDDHERPIEELRRLLEMHRELRGE